MQFSIDITERNHENSHLLLIMKNSCEHGLYYGLSLGKKRKAFDTSQSFFRNEIAAEKKI